MLCAASFINSAVRSAAGDVRGVPEAVRDVRAARMLRKRQIIEIDVCQGRAWGCRYE